MWASGASVEVDSIRERHSRPYPEAPPCRLSGVRLVMEQIRIARWITMAVGVSSSHWLVGGYHLAAVVLCVAFAALCDCIGARTVRAS
jgi:hypothetical protein